MPIFNIYKNQQTNKKYHGRQSPPGNFRFDSILLIHDSRLLRSNLKAEVLLINSKISQFATSNRFIKVPIIDTTNDHRHIHALDKQFQINIQFRGTSIKK